MHSLKVALYFSNNNHDSVLAVILKALKKMDCEVMLFTADGIRQEVYSDREILCQYHISNARFTPFKVLKLLKEADFVIMDQLYSFRELLFFSIFKIPSPNLFLVHNCNTWFSPQRPRKLVPLLKHVMTQVVKSQVGHFAVAGENMFYHCKEDLGINNIELIPFRYGDFDPVQDKPDELYCGGEPIRLVVPGMISERRNYHLLLDTIAQEELKNKVELVLLGRPTGEYGLNILHRAEQLINKGYTIHFWKEYIDNATFDAEIRKAHVLFSCFDPLYLTNNGQVEIYGVTKETGIALLMYNKAKVGILPASFKQMRSISNQTISYKNVEELRDILLDIFTGKLDIAHLQSNAVSNAMTMNMNKIIERLKAAYEVQIN